MVSLSHFVCLVRSLYKKVTSSKEEKREKETAKGEIHKSPKMSNERKGEKEQYNE